MESRNKTVSEVRSAVEAAGHGKQAAIVTIWDGAQSPYPWEREETTAKLAGICLWLDQYEERPELLEEVRFLRDMARNFRWVSMPSKKGGKR